MRNEPTVPTASDRYLEQFNSGLVLPAGKYEVSRMLAGPATTGIKDATPLLAAPIAA
jgi:hypothetical protein